MARVSVIIPTYNRARLVGEAIESVLAQTYRDFELLVVDDCSNDNTAEVVSRYGDKVRYLSRKVNGGCGAARNEAIRLSTSEFVTFLDSDDLYLPRRLEVGVGLLEANPEYGASYVDMQIIDVNGKLSVPSHLARCGCCPSGWLLDWLFRRQLISPNTITLRREVLDRTGWFGQSLESGEDTVFFWRLARVTRIVGVPEVLVTGRDSPDSMSIRSSGDEKHLALLNCWVAGETLALAEFTELTPRQRKLLARRIWNLHQQRARLLLRLGRIEEAQAVRGAAKAMARVEGLRYPGVRLWLSQPKAKVMRKLRPRLNSANRRFKSLTERRSHCL
jgi:cellulose synthase/poly-beta-1,6-N-acetylglucosamine synthase-like glycosyltransferase